MGGECWAGMGTPNIKMENNLVLVDMGGIIREGDQDGIKAKNCVNPYIANCRAKDKFCIGTVHSEYIYRVTYPGAKTTPTAATHRVHTIRMTTPVRIVFPTFKVAVP